MIIYLRMLPGRLLRIAELTHTAVAADRGHGMIHSEQLAQRGGEQQ